MDLFTGLFYKLASVKDKAHLTSNLFSKLADTNCFKRYAINKNECTKNFEQIMQRYHPQDTKLMEMNIFCFALIKLHQEKVIPRDGNLSLRQFLL